VRCLPDHGRDEPANCTILGQRGPFGTDDEKALFTLLGIDGLVTRNSGGAAVAAKLVVARELGIPVRMEPRPTLPAADRAFETPEALLEALAP
jgi:precorrin-6A/cobalt-precorrin-6A reductase